MKKILFLLCCFSFSHLAWAVHPQVGCSLLETHAIEVPPNMVIVFNNPIREFLNVTRKRDALQLSRHDFFLQLLAENKISLQGLLGKSEIILNSLHFENMTLRLRYEVARVGERTILNFFHREISAPLPTAERKSGIFVEAPRENIRFVKDLMRAVTQEHFVFTQSKKKNQPDQLYTILSINGEYWRVHFQREIKGKRIVLSKVKKDLIVENEVLNELRAFGQLFNFKKEDLKYLSATVTRNGRPAEFLVTREDFAFLNAVHHITPEEVELILRKPIAQYQINGVLKFAMFSKPSGKEHYAIVLSFAYDSNNERFVLSDAVRKRSSPQMQFQKALSPEMLASKGKVLENEQGPMVFESRTGNAIGLRRLIRAYHETAGTIYYEARYILDGQHLNLESIIEIGSKYERDVGQYVKLYARQQQSQYFPGVAFPEMTVTVGKHRIVAKYPPYLQVLFQNASFEDIQQAFESISEGMLPVSPGKKPYLDCIGYTAKGEPFIFVVSLENGQPVIIDIERPHHVKFMQRIRSQGKLIRLESFLDNALSRAQGGF